MWDEKGMFAFDKKNRTIETKSYRVPIKLEHGWDYLVFTHKVITGWTVPVRKEKN